MPPPSSPGLAGAAGPLHQVYVTHCSREDSVRSEVGYKVRAASVNDPGLFEDALEVPGYDLPVYLRAAPPPLDESPRRLALVRLASGRRVLVHSAPVVLDKGARGYLSHVIRAPEGLAPADALRSWAAPEWAPEYAPGKPKALAPLARLPRGAAVSDAVLRAYLSDAPPPDGTLATTVCPARLAPDAGLRRLMLERVLEGWLRALEGAGGKRGRLYLHAEPGLAALLLYGAARLLPRGCTQELTFSTYEDSFGLGRFKLALAVNTYLGDPQKPLDADNFRLWGYGLDAFHPDRHSPELKATSPAVRELVEAAAQGEWGLIDCLHQCWGATRVPAGSLREVVPLAQALDRLEHGSPSVDDLLRLRQDPRCAAAMAQHEARVWAVVGDPKLASNPQVRQAFAELFRKPQNLAAIRARAVQALTANDIPGWQANWDLLKSVCDAGSLPAQFQHVLKAVPAPASAADRPRQRLLLAEVLASGAADPNNPPYDLLRPFAPEHLDETLRQPSLPPLWAAAAIYLGMADPATATAARKHLEASDATRLSEFLRLLFAQPTDHVEEVAKLIDKSSGAGKRLFGHLLDTGTTHLTPQAWVKLLQRLDAYEGPGWPQFWQAEDRLVQLLTVLGDTRDAVSIWQYFGAFVDRTFAGGDPGRAEIYRQLTEARGRLSTPGQPQFAPPRDVRDRLYDWDIIRRVMRAGEGDPAAWKLFDAACRRQGVEKAVLLADQLGRYGHLDPDREARAFEPFASLFLAFTPPMGDEEDYARGAEYWLKMVALAQVPKPEKFQAFFFSRFPPLPMRLPLLDKPNVQPLVSAPARDLVVKAYNQIKRVPDPTKAVSAAAGVPGGGAKRKLPKEFLIAGGVVLALILGGVVAISQMGGEPEDPGGGSTGKQDPSIAKIEPKKIDKPPSTKPEDKKLPKDEKAIGFPPPKVDEERARAERERKTAEALVAATGSSADYLKGLVKYIKPVAELMALHVSVVPAAILARAKEQAAIQAKRDAIRKKYDEMSDNSLVGTFLDGEADLGRLKRKATSKDPRLDEVDALDRLFEPLKKRNPYISGGTRWEQESKEHETTRAVIREQLVQHLVSRDLLPKDAAPIDFRQLLVRLFEQKVDEKTTVTTHLYRLALTPGLKDNPREQINRTVDALKRSLKDNSGRK